MNKYLRAIFYNYLFFFINLIAYLILTPIAIHSMGDEFYGLWSVLNAVILFSSIGTLGIGSIVNKFSSESSSINQKTQISDIIFSGTLLIIPMALLTSIIIFFSSSFISNHIKVAADLNKEFTIALQICAIGIIPQFLAKVPQGFLLSKLNNDFVRIMDFMGSVLPWVGAIILCQFEENLIWIALWSVVLQTIILLIYIIKIHKYLQFTFKVNSSIIKRMFSYSLFMFIESSAIALFQQFDRIIVGFILGPAMAGVYSVGTSVGLRLSTVSGQITEVMLPYASLKNSLSDNNALLIIFRKLSQYISIIIGILGSMLILWMNEVLTIWISKDYANNYYQIFCILIIGYVILGLNRPAHQTLQGMGQVKYTSTIYLISSIIMLIGLFVFSKFYGLVGAALANSLMALLLSMNLLVYHLLNVKATWKTLLEDLFWGVTLPVISYLIISLNQSIIIKIFVSLIIFALTFIKLRNDSFIKNQIKIFYNSLRSNQSI